MKRILAVFAITRILLLLAVAAPDVVPPCERFRVAIEGPPGAFEDQVVPWSKSATGQRYNLTEFRPLDAFTHMDARYYLSIAAFSYRTNADGSVPREAGFFPLYPLIVRSVAGTIEMVVGWVSPPTPRSTEVWLVAAWLVSNGALLLAALALMRFAEGIGQGDWGLLAATALLVSPVSFFGSAMLSESLFLFLSIECLRRANRREFVFAACLGGAAAMTRAIGVALVVPLLVSSFERRSDRRESIGDACTFSLVPTGAAVIPAWHGIALGAPFAYAEVQSLFGHGRFPEIEGFLTLLKLFGQTPLDTARNAVQLAALAAAVLGLWITWREAQRGALPWSIPVWGASSLAIPLLSGHIISLPRYVFAVFPVWIGLGILFSRLAARGWWFAVPSMALQIVGLLIFAKAWPILI